MKTTSYLFSLAVILITGNAVAQDGNIKGTLTDEMNQPIPYATVALLDDTVIIRGISTDDNGDFTFKHLVPGVYNIQLSSMGYRTKRIKNVEVTPGGTAYIYRSLNATADTMKTIEITSESYEKPIINPTFSTVTSISIDQIEKGATPKNDIIRIVTTLTPGVMPTDDGKDLYMRGSRRGTTAYYIDGNRVIGSPEVPGLGVSSIEVLTGGVPAEYGDCTGGLVIITTKEYKTEMRRKQMARTAWKERQESEKKKTNPADEEEQ